MDINEGDDQEFWKIFMQIINENSQRKILILIKILILKLIFWLIFNPIYQIIIE